MYNWTLCVPMCSLLYLGPGEPVGERVALELDTIVVLVIFHFYNVSFTYLVFADFTASIIICRNGKES